MNEKNMTDLELLVAISQWKNEIKVYGMAACPPFMDEASECYKRTYESRWWIPLLREVRMYKLSRYWNRFAYWVIDLGHSMLWDYTKKNKDYLRMRYSSTGRHILTDKDIHHYRK